MSRMVDRAEVTVSWDTAGQEPWEPAAARRFPEKKPAPAPRPLCHLMPGGRWDLETTQVGKHCLVGDLQSAGHLWDLLALCWGGRQLLPLGQAPSPGPLCLLSFLEASVGHSTG